MEKQIERYYQGGEKAIQSWMDDHKNDPDYLAQVKAMGLRIKGDLEAALAEEDNGHPLWKDPLWIARCRGELRHLD